jgi:DNA polymerase/3'-5' exonuclease PolX
MSVDYYKAKKIADRAVELLKPYCEQIHIAGSIRRMRPEVKDIEIVCIPKKEDRSTDLFGGTEKIISNDFSGALLQITDQVIKGKIDGRYMQIKLKGGMILDLFLPVPEDYYRQYAIRTGSADYAHHVIAKAWTRKGWVGVSNVGLRKRTECEGGGNYPWRCKKKDPALPPVWKSEGEFFAWIGVEYIDPEFREFNKTVNIAQ